MTIFSFKKKSQKQNNKLSLFIKKYKVSFKAYELLRKFVVARLINSNSLDFVHPINWKPKVLKNVSPRAMKSLHRLSSIYEKNINGLICQIPKNYSTKQKLSSKAKKLLYKINNNKNLFDEIDFKIKKYKINKILD